MTNPWLTSVRFIAKGQKEIDTATITKAYVAQKNIELKNENGEIEIINAVLPLLNSSDEELRPLLHTRLFNFMMTYNVTQNVESIYDDCYLSLLSSALFLVLQKEKDSNYQKSMLESIENTLRIFYYDNKEFINYREQLIKNPLKTIVNDPEQKKYGNIDLSKALIHAYMIAKDKLAEQYQVENILKTILGYFFYTLVKSQEFQIHTFLKAKLAGGLAQKAA